MLSTAKHLFAHRERPFAALRVTTHDRSWLLKIIIAPLRLYRLSVVIVHAMPGAVVLLVRVSCRRDVWRQPAGWRPRQVFHGWYQTRFFTSSSYGLHPRLDL